MTAICKRWEVPIPRLTVECPPRITSIWTGACLCDFLACVQDAFQSDFGLYVHHLLTFGCEGWMVIAPQSVGMHRVPCISSGKADDMAALSIAADVYN